MPEQFYEILEYFLRPDNSKIWGEVQNLAQKGDDDTLLNYVREAQRLTTTQRNVRYAVAPGELEGQKVEPGHPVVMLLVRIPVSRPHPRPKQLLTEF